MCFDGTTGSKCLEFISISFLISQRFSYTYVMLVFKTNDFSNRLVNSFLRLQLCKDSEPTVSSGHIHSRSHTSSCFVMMQYYNFKIKNNECCERLFF